MDNIVVDANNLFYRSICSSDSFYRKNNINISDKNAVYIKSFFRLLYNSTSRFHNEFSKIYIVWDKTIDPKGVNWRKVLNPNYKAQRDKSSETRHYVDSLTMPIKKISDGMGLRSILPLHSEGDDIMNYIVRKVEGDSVIVSSDKDFYQCVNDRVSIYDAKCDKMITKSNFEDHSIVALENFVKWKSIKGDPSDNISGLMGYGDKKAKKLVENWEVESNKLSKEDMAIFEECFKLIDINSTPLTDKEVYTTEFQLNRTIDRLGRVDMANILKKYNLNIDIYEIWDKYFELKCLVDFF